MNFIFRWLRRPIVGNALSLYSVQGLNYLLPLLILPYLLHVLGPANYGAIVFAQSLMAYAVIVTEFGFNFTATREISVARSNELEVRRIYWSTMAAKTLLLLICAVLITLIVGVVPQFRASWPVFAASGLLVLGNVVFPQWYFQGLERLKDVALIQAVSKCVTTAAVLLFVRSSHDVLAAAVILSAPQVVGAICATVLGRPLTPSRFYRPTLAEVIACLKRSRHMFASGISMTLYLHTNTFMLGLFSGHRAVALYSVGTRLIAALQGMVTPITQSIFPRASILFAEQPAHAWALLKRAARIVVPALALCSLLMGICAPSIVRIVGGGQYLEAAGVLRIMAPIPVCVTVAMFVGQLVMVNTGQAARLVRIYVVVGVLNLIILPLLIQRYGVHGAAVALLIAETLGPLLMLATVWRSERATAARAVELPLEG